MTKLLSEGHIHADCLAWRPWDDDRTTPFIAHGLRGTASVKVLSRDPESRAESLLYRLDRGWSADRIENTVYENLLVLDGEVDANGNTLRKNTYAYRPEGHVTTDVSTRTGATVVAYSGAPGDLASPIPIDWFDADGIPWTRFPVAHPDANYFIKMLRGDEENLDTYSLLRAVRGYVSDRRTSHDAPEEGFLLEGLYESYDGVTDGRYVSTRGTYTHRLPGSPHGFNNIIEDLLSFKHDYFVAESEEILDVVLASYPKATAAVKALKEGRAPNTRSSAGSGAATPM